MQALLVRVAAIAFAAFLSFNPLLAQGGGEDDYDFSEIPVEEEDIPYIGVGGGYQLLVTLLDMTELNKVNASLGLGAFTGGLFMHGGGGWTAIGIIPNVRLGVFGGAGSKEVTKTETIADSAFDRSMRFSAGYTVAHIDYAIPVFSKFTVAPGVMIGGGSTTLEYTQTKEGTSFSSLFDPAKSNGPGGDLSYQTSVTRSYPVFIPTLNIEYALTQFILVRAGAGYSMTTLFGDTWDDRHGNVVSGVPDINADGLTFSAGLFLGLFQQ